MVASDPELALEASSHGDGRPGPRSSSSSTPAATPFFLKLLLGRWRGAVRRDRGEERVALGWKMKKADVQGPRVRGAKWTLWLRSRALKPGLIRFFFFIRNSVFLSQISPALSRFLQANRAYKLRLAAVGRKGNGSGM